MKMREISRVLDKKLTDNNDLNKGIVSLILPDDEMPTVNSGALKGINADICLNPLGKKYA